MSVDYLEWLGGLFEKPRAARDNVLELQKPYPISCRRVGTHTHARKTLNKSNMCTFCVCVRVLARISVLYVHVYEKVEKNC